jgi:serine/threonine protein kinase
MTEEAIFCEAAEIQDPHARANFIDQACGENQQLRERIHGLIQAEGAADSLLDKPIEMDGTLADKPQTLIVGTKIGPYKLLEKIGEGGMGIVFVAERKQPIRTRVAIKVIKPGMDSRAVIARFEAERQALAMMDHPNIARVLDAGTTESGQPYFVMEHIKGVSITEYCNENCLSTEMRLKLFCQVCSAVQHSHQKGIIHRDLKPSNILVAEYDHQPVIKVIDFGVAKALNQSLTDKTLYTERLNLVGTLQYMSPEQAKLNQKDIDTRSDIYSLGVVLYELLTGRPPFDRKTLEDAGFEGMCRIIREQEPPRPSESLTSLDAFLAKSIAKQRGSKPESLRKAFRGDLDRVVMMALAKERNRRYPTAIALADDLERFMQQEPVQAIKPSWTYLLSKSVRRHAAAYAVVASLLLALVIMSASLLVGLVTIQEAKRKSDEANQQLQQEKQVAVAAKDNMGKALALVMDMIQDAAPKTLASIASKATEEFQHDQQTEYFVLKEVGAQLLKSLASRPTDVHARLDELSASQFGADSLQRAEMLRYLAYCKNDIEAAKRAANIEETHLGSPTANTKSLLGALYFSAEEPEAASKHLKAAVKNFDPQSVQLVPWEIPQLFLAELARREGSNVEYERWLSEGIAVLRAGRTVNSLLGLANNNGNSCPDLQFREWFLNCVDPATLQTNEDRKTYYRTAVRLYWKMGRMELAEKLHASSDDSVLDAWAYGYHPVRFIELMDYDQAKIYLQQSIELGEALVSGRGQESWQQPWRIWQMALVDYELGNLEMARDGFRQIAEIVDADTDIFSEEVDLRFSIVCRILGQLESSPETPLESALRFRELAGDERFEGPWAFGVNACLALAYREKGEKAKAAELLASDLLQYSPTPNEATHWLETILLSLYRDTEQLDLAVDYMRQAIDYRNDVLFWYHPEHGLAKYRFAKFLFEQNHELPFAKQLLQEAQSHLKGRTLLQKHLDEIDRLLSQLKSR